MDTENREPHRKRLPNFTTAEEEMLVKLVNKYKSVIECKKSGATTWKEKENCWKKIEEEFNLNGGGIKDWRSLKVKYNNLKRKTKQKCAENKLNLTHTGGGPYKEVKLDQTDLLIKDIIGPQLEGLDNIYDSDAGQLQQIRDDDHQPYQEEIIEIVVDEDINSTNTEPEGTRTSKAQTEMQKPVNLQENKSECEEEFKLSDGIHEDDSWSTYKPTTLKVPIARKLKGKRLKTNTGATKYVGIQYQLIQAKLEFVQLQKEKYLKEHELKMQVLEKKHILAERQLAG